MIATHWRAAGGAAAATVSAPPRPVLAQNWRRIVRMGAVAGVGQVFIALSNMPVRLDERVMVKPVLSMGYLALLILPFAAGHRMGHQIRREGASWHAAGAHEVVGGAACGAVTGGGLSLLAVLLANFDLRDPLVNWSPILLDRLSFGNPTWFAVPAWLLIGAAVGAAGGLLRVLGPRTRRAAVTMAVAVAGAAVLESLVVDLAEGFRLEGLTDRLYARRGGLEWTGALGIAAVSGALSVAGHRRLQQARTRIAGLQGAQRTRTNALLIVVAGAALVILPMFAGKITNELLANVGLFVLLALGLNIVVGPGRHPRSGLRGLLRGGQLHRRGAHRRDLAEDHPRAALAGRPHRGG